MKLGGPNSGAALLVALVSLAIFAATPVYAGPVSAAADPSINLGQSVVVLRGPWRFHIGDDPRWASPDFDDSGWEQVDLSTAPGSYDPTFGNADFTGGWTARGHAGYAGYAWYRLKIKLAQNNGPLSLMLPDNIDDAYQVFADGQYAGAFGDFSGKRPKFYNSRALDFRLPILPTTRPVTIALRFWMANSTLIQGVDSGGLHGPPQIGLTPVADAITRLRWDDVLRAYSSAFMLMFFFCAVSVTLAILYVIDPSDSIFLWLSIVYGLLVLSSLSLVVGAWTMKLSLVWVGVLQDVLLRHVILGMWLIAWWKWFDLRDQRWIVRTVWIVTAVNALLMACVREPLLGWVVPGRYVIPLNTMSMIARLVSAALLGIIVVLGIRRQGREGLVVLPAVILLAVASFQTELAVMHVRTAWFPGGMQLTMGTIAQLGLLVSMFILLLRRFQRSQHRQLVIEQDLRQAQQVQQLLMPEQNAVVPGFLIESEYRPAQQVGGDFFQVIPDAEGGVLIAIGDVAGKGAQAGILVGMLVGTMRTCVQFGLSPAMALDTLNQRLCGREHALSTCLIMHIDANGQGVYANAGHLPPYLNGKELPIEGALPLGVLPDTIFPTGRFALAPGDRLLLMSDGVVEATNADGTLFGFERLERLLAQSVSAAALAQEAQAFGQQDDVLVLRIVRGVAERMALHAEPIAVLS